MQVGPESAQGPTSGGQGLKAGRQPGPQRQRAEGDAEMEGTWPQDPRAEEDGKAGNSPPWSPRRNAVCRHLGLVHEGLCRPAGLRN